MKLNTHFTKASLCMMLTFGFAFSSFGQNATNGGEVGYNQTIYQGETPETIVNITEASGGDPNLDLEYIWYKFTAINPNSLATASGIINKEYYNSPPLYESTYFYRVAVEQVLLSIKQVLILSLSLS